MACHEAALSERVVRLLNFEQRWPLTAIRLNIEVNAWKKSISFVNLLGIAFP